MVALAPQDNKSPLAQYIPQFPGYDQSAMPGPVAVTTPADGGMPQQTPGLRGLDIPQIAPMGSGMPSLPVPAMPSVTTPYLTARANADAAHNTPAAVDGIHNGFLHVLGKIGDVANSVLGGFGPLGGAIASNIPGTTFAHNYKVAQLDARANQLQAQNQADAQTAQTNANTRLLTDKAQDDETAAATPAAPEYNYVDGPNGKVAIQKGTTNYTPVTSTVDAAPLEGKDAPLQHIETDQGIYTFNPATGEANMVTGSDGKPLQTPQKLTPSPPTLGPDGKPHTYLIDGKGNKVSDLGVHYERPMSVHVGVNAQPLDLNSGNSQAAIDAIGTGAIKLSDVFARGMTAPQKMALVAAVKSKYPQFTSGDHDIEVGANKYFTTGKGGQALAAFDTTQNHLKTLADASDALHNGNITLFNRASQAYAQATGSEAPTDFNAVKNAVKGEVARALTGNVTVSEQAELDKDFNNASSPAQIAGVAKKYTTLIEGKKAALRTQYQQSQTARPNFDGTQAPSQSGTPDTYVRVNGKLVRQ